MPPKKKKTKAKKKQQGVGAHCKILLQYLHPAMIIEEVMPKNGRRDKQHLADCIVVSRETRKIKKLPKVCIVVKHPSFGDRLIYCAERYAKVTAEGDRDGWFDTEAATQLPGVFPLTFKQAFEQDKKRQPIDLSFLDLDKEGGHQTRTEDIALARSQGIDVDDDNEPAPENIPPAGADINYQDNLYGQTWGWNGTCNRKSNHHSHEGAKIEGMSRADLKQTTKLDMFLIFFPINYLEDVVVVETSKVLVGMTYQPMTMGELVRFFGCIFFMSCFSGMDRNDWFSSSPITMGKGAPYRLSRYMPGYRFNQIMNCLCLTTKDPNILDRFWEVRDLIAEWNKNMQEVYIPSWVSCLDESMSIWHMRWTCPGYVFCPRKPHPVGNEYHTIADGTSTILYAAEIVMGKDTPDDYVHQYEAEEGKTSALLARLTRSIWHTGKLVILDSGFCVLKALINLKKKRGLYAGAVIKKRRYWPSYIQGGMIDIKFCYGYDVGSTDVLHGVLDDVSYDIFCMKEEDYVMKIMATYGCNSPPMRDRKKATRTLVSGVKTEFEYIEPVANHFDYRHCVDDNNHLRHMRPSIEETWKTHRWALRCLSFFLAVSEVNAFLCFRNWVWSEKEKMYFHAFRRHLSIEMMTNTYDEDDGEQDFISDEPRRSPRQGSANNHVLTSAPINSTKWSLAQGWIKNCIQKYQQVRCTNCSTQTRTYCPCDPGIFICAQCHVLHVHHVLSGGCSNEIKSPRNKNRKLNMEN